MGPQVRRADRAAKSQVFPIIHISHQDDVEAPITDWLDRPVGPSLVLSRNFELRDSATPHAVKIDVDHLAMEASR